MRVKILAVGKMKAGPERDLYDRYCKRFDQSGRSLGLTGLQTIEIAESRLSDIEARKSQEAVQLLEKSDAGAKIFLLDECGKDISSQDFAKLIEQEQEVGTSHLAFVLGGPDGHGSQMIAAANRKLRFGSLTWPHQIARILLAEQLYRSNTIRLGHPYHRE